MTGGRGRGRGRGDLGRGGRGGGGGGGRGKKNEATKAADKARLAALMAERRAVEKAGGSWDPLRGCAREGSMPGPAAAEEDDDVECMGESTRAQAEAARDAAAREHAVDVDSEDDAVMGGPPVRGMLDACGLAAHLR